MSVTAFSSGDDVIQRKIDCQQNAVKTNNLNEVYEIEKSVSWIIEGGFARVALQFPDELLVDAPQVAGLIQDGVKDAIVFILGDTSYGSCCVDEISAQHYSADCIIHFGHACLSPTGRLPVLYVFGKSEISIDDCVRQLTELGLDTDMKAVLAYDTMTSYSIEKIFSELQCHFTNLVLSTLSIPSQSSPESTNQDVQSSNHLAAPLTDSINEGHISEPHLQPQEQVLPSTPSAISYCGRVIHLPPMDDINNYSFIFVGDTEGATLTNLMMRFNKCPFYSYNQRSKVCQRETLNVNKALMKRYYLIERAKDANIVGILAGTLGIAKYRNVFEHLKALLKKAGKKSYTFAVGKLNPAKLANFAEVDIYVLVACPESTLLDQAEFYRPIVSPLEMEIACNQAREWTGEYSTDFTDILPGAAMHVESQDSGNSDDSRADVSLISNRVRVLGVREEPSVSEVPSQEIVLRSEAMAVASIAENAGEYLANRSWKGLEQHLGKTPIAKAVEGQYGIAASYQNEPAGS